VILKESDIQKTCEDFLAVHGWRIFRMEQNYSERKKKRVGEPGMPDCLAIRYRGKLGRECYADVLFIEWKRQKGGKVSLTQKLWHSIERVRGAKTLIAGMDFDPSIEGFQEWYRKSGL
jgi:hypothetical protein